MSSWTGTYGEFIALLAARQASGEPISDNLGLVLVDDKPAECVHPFEVTAMQWHARRTPGHLMVTIDYVCPQCGKTVARSKRDIRLKGT